MRRQVLAAATAALLLLGGAGAAHGQFVAQGRAEAQVTSLRIGTPQHAVATTHEGCTSVSVSWAEAPGADSYDVDVRIDDGVWASVAVDTGPFTTIATSAPTGSTAAWRVTGRHRSSAWTGEVAVTPVLDYRG